ncbi:cytochrome P450 family protein [Lentzea terrae]|uniref:cytochrome P450 family protein n=1 Tax=Lentzea terrae TaxID=2200761 RepID=UPI000DD3D490|nr:cytochrome P450 [Lentzea terrae]
MNTGTGATPGTPTTNPALAQAVLTGHPGHRNHDIEETLRAAGPLHPAVLPNGVRIFVVTTGYERTRALLADPRFSKDSQLLTSTIHAQVGPGELSGMFGESMLMSDQPRHTRLRTPVAAAFTPRRVAAMRSQIEQLAGDLLDAADTGEPLDLIQALAFPLPITVIGDLLGVPASDHHQLRGWTEQLMGDDETITVPASQAMTGYLQDLIDGKRRRGTDTDLLGALIAATDSDDRLTPDELIAMAMLLIVAGHETTTNLIGNLVYALLSDPHRWHEVTTQPALITAAVEETLRWDPPVRHATYRVSTESIDIDGHLLPAGEMALINLGAAGRDPHSTPRGHAFDLHRAGAHTTFGHGIHFCLGASLARMEAEISLAQLTARWPAARLASTTPPGRTDSAIMNGLTTLMITTDR